MNLLTSHGSFLQTLCRASYPLLQKSFDFQNWLFLLVIYRHGWKNLCQVEKCMSLRILNFNSSSRKGRGQWTVYYTSPQSFILTFCHSVDQQLQGIQMNFDWLIYLVKCSNVSSNNCDQQKREFVYHHWGCTEINLQLSYPLRSLSSNYSRLTKSHTLKTKYTCLIPFNNGYIIRGYIDREFAEYFSFLSRFYGFKILKSF